MNLKTLQHIMAHFDVGVTLNIYTHLGEEDVKEEMEEWSGKTGTMVLIEDTALFCYSYI